MLVKVNLFFKIWGAQRLTHGLPTFPGDRLCFPVHTCPLLHVPTSPVP